MDRRRKGKSNRYPSAYEGRAERTCMNIWELCKNKTNEELQRLYDEKLARKDIVLAEAISIWMNLYNNQVEVVGGVKVPRGTKGKVFFIKSQINRDSLSWGYLVGIEKSDGSKVFTNVKNVKVVKQ